MTIHDINQHNLPGYTNKLSSINTRFDSPIFNTNKNKNKLPNFLKNNITYLKYQDYNVRLNKWRFKKDNNGIYVTGYLNNGNYWRSDYLIYKSYTYFFIRLVDKHQTVYRCYY